jgi:hypothetical protein
MNTNDFYAPFKKALDDFGKTGEIGNVTSPVKLGEKGAIDSLMPEDIAETPKADELLTKGGAVIEALGDVTGSTGLASKLPVVPTLPAGFGTKYVYTITLQLPPPIGAKVFDVNLNPYSEQISIMRDLLKVFVTIGFWFAMVRTIRGSSADGNA